jgi:hypothetical protein
MIEENLALPSTTRVSTSRPRWSWLSTNTLRQA